ncbi:uncharacterized protein CCR75_002957 [Bremia lactucae]|uniref:Uncharacterized protein n=1 Tax=Bremia lactucae TaxID=4779 RepID=A0A976NZQ1_BRELC|nr:hypothetical protein CCR75_002957 [Bremia lactucae]
MAPLPEASALPPPAILLTSMRQQNKVGELQEPESENACNNAQIKELAEAAMDHAMEIAVQEDTINMDDHSTLKKSVRFNCAEVVEFEPTMWTATVSSEGVPLGMSVDVRRRTKRQLDTYESERNSFRVGRQDFMELGYLEPEERLDILEKAGHSISIISHVERETVRINRERSESNEYDLMYQYGLGEVPLMVDSNVEMTEQDFGDDGMLVDDNSASAYLYGIGSRNMVVDSFIMEDMKANDSINARAYDGLSIVYASDCILGDGESSDESFELPYSIDSFDSPLSCDFLRMSTSPTDVSSTSDCAHVAAKPASCALSVSKSSANCSPTEAANAVEATSVVA